MNELTGLSGGSAFRPTENASRSVFSPTRRPEGRPTRGLAGTRVGMLALVAVISVGLAACNTVRGVGRDIEAGGEAIQKATK